MPEEISKNRTFRKKEGQEDWIPFKSLTGIVRLVLCVDWDPIGVFGHKQTLDEYDNYVSPVVALLERGTSKEEITELLRSFEEERMGLRDPSKGRPRGSSEDHLQNVALKLIQATTNFKTF